MNAPPFNDYDRVTYPSMAHPQTFAETLAVRGFLRGLEVAPPGRCRVLELGCGDGFNLAAMAVVHPRTTYTGIDYSADAIARGRRLTADLGLDQIRLVAADIRELDRIDPPLEEFDYIVAHGVYSWVPADVREALMAAIGRRLAPHGVAFVSYLALPGAHLRELVRTMIRFHTRFETDPRAKAAQAKALLHLVAEGTTDPNYYARTIAAELELIEAHSDESLFHDELSSVSAPLLFTEFVEQAARYGLQFLSESEYLLPVGRALTEAAWEQLRPLEASRILQEQYLDFIHGRRFRQTLLCRDGLPLHLDASRTDRLWVSFSGQPVGANPGLTNDTPAEFHGLKAAALRVTSPAEKATLYELAARRGAAMAVPELFKVIRDRLAGAGLAPETDFEATLRLFLCRVALPGLVEFSWGEQPYTLAVPERPCAHPLAVWLMHHDAPSGFSYTGRFVEVKGALGRHLLTLLDGNRDRPELETEIRTFLAARRAAAQAAGEEPNLPAPDDPGIPEQLARSLTGLAGLGLLRRP